MAPIFSENSGKLPQKSVDVPGRVENRRAQAHGPRFQGPGGAVGQGRTVQPRAHSDLPSGQLLADLLAVHSPDPERQHPRL